MEETIQERNTNIIYLTIIPAVLLVIIFAFFVPVLKEELFPEPINPGELGPHFQLTIVFNSPIIWFLTLLIFPCTILIIVETSKILRNKKSKKNICAIAFIAVNAIIFLLALAVFIFDIVLIVK